MSLNERKGSGGVVVSDDVIVKIAEVAAKDVPGVKGLASRTTDFRSIVKDRSVKPVQIEMLSGAMEITMYITSVSYTHLDVYKRQRLQRALRAHRHRIYGGVYASECFPKLSCGGRAA